MAVNVLKRTWKLLRKPFHYSLNDRLLAVCTGYHWCIQPHTIIRNSVKVKGACNGVQKMTSLPSHCILNIPNVRFLQSNRSTCSISFWRRCNINPLNAELNPICHLLTLLGGATIVVVSRLRVKIKLGEVWYLECGRGLSDSGQRPVAGFLKQYNALLHTSKGWEFLDHLGFPKRTVPVNSWRTNRTILLCNKSQSPLAAFTNMALLRVDSV